MRTLITAAIASAAMLTAAHAQTIGTATTDLNIRSGPDPQFPVIGMIRENQRATVLGCIDGSRWCQIDLRGRAGWAYSQYMTLSGDMVAILPAPELEFDVAANPLVAPPPPVDAYRVPPPMGAWQAPQPRVTYAPPVTYQPPVVAYRNAPGVIYREPADETTAVAPRDYAGRLIAPRETIYAATTPPRAYVPPRAVQSYLLDNPLEPIWLEGNLAVGAGLPDDIELMPVPNSRYHYTYVNDYPVLVEPASRRIVYVSR